jgi:hypothetical protein
MLIARSLERSIAQLDLARFSGKTVWLEVYSLTGDTQFANKLIGTEMQEKGLKLATDSNKADFTVKVFLTAFGVDTGQTLIGLPALFGPGRQPSGSRDRALQVGPKPRPHPIASVCL